VLIAVELKILFYRLTTAYIEYAKTRLVAPPFMFSQPSWESPRKSCIPPIRRLRAPRSQVAIMAKCIRAIQSPPLYALQQLVNIITLFSSKHNIIGYIYIS